MRVIAGDAGVDDARSHEKSKKKFSCCHEARKSKKARPKVSNSTHCRRKRLNCTSAPEASQMDHNKFLLSSKANTIDMASGLKSQLPPRANSWYNASKPTHQILF
eukprot:gnl/MRDRNA2_/MRDRNA2_61772_c0_seq2.p2 gnl/MRDRNA2_/MRDRNA2_61772_c0~~gnl/MRDRNA2_/MRDRNA2_61772_c0_seq2.p2  ORF type:complete len:105 (-),score=13.07 gnl/MRDRNA2_/MRDRNA2_61772_c0_seq2:148-462(-)